MRTQMIAELADGFYTYLAESDQSEIPSQWTIVFDGASAVSSTKAAHITADGVEEHEVTGWVAPTAAIKAVQWAGHLHLKGTVLVLGRAAVLAPLLLLLPSHEDAVLFLRRGTTTIDIKKLASVYKENMGNLKEPARVVATAALVGGSVPGLAPSGKTCGFTPAEMVKFVLASEAYPPAVFDGLVQPTVASVTSFLVANSFHRVRRDKGFEQASKEAAKHSVSQFACARQECTGEMGLYDKIRQEEYLHFAMAVNPDTFTLPTQTAFAEHVSRVVVALELLQGRTVEDRGGWIERGGDRLLKIEVGITAPVGGVTERSIFLDAMDRASNTEIGAGIVEAVLTLLGGKLLVVAV